MRRDRLQRDLPTSPRGWCGGRCGFTLVELLVVMSIMVIILAMLLPASARLLEDRKIAAAETTVQGMMATARASSLGASGIETGLFFYLTPDGIQHIRSIERDLVGAGECTPQPACREAWAKVFRVTPDHHYTLPPPVRVVPRYAIEPDEPEPVGPSYLRFSDVELANNDFFAPPVEDAAQRHRNYFTMVFSSDGELLVDREVIIRDDDLDQDPQGLGDLVGLPVGYGMTNGTVTADVTEYWGRDNSKTEIDPTGNKTPILFPIIDIEHYALNFPSVDGLLVYDDALFNELPDIADRRAFLIRTGRPFYIHRITGALVRGPLGENE